jgi:hypothetical protein
VPSAQQLRCQLASSLFQKSCELTRSAKNSALFQSVSLAFIVLTGVGFQIVLSELG